MPAAGRWRPRARREVDKGAKTDLFKLMKQRGRTRLTSAVWAQALERARSAGHGALIDER